MLIRRRRERRDAEGIRAIYNHYVNHSTTLFDMVARTLDEQVQWIDEHSGGHPAVVAALDGEIVGFGSLSPFRARPAYSTRSRTPSTCSTATRAGASGGCCSTSCSAAPRPTGSTR